MKKYFFVYLFVFLAVFAVLGQNPTDNTDDIQAAESLLPAEYSKELYLIKKDKPSYKNKIGIGIDQAFVYYRRSFGFSTDIFANVKLVRGLYFEGGSKMMFFKYALTHFFPLTVNLFDNEIFGAIVGLRAGLKYYFDILEHFGLILGSSFTVSCLMVVAEDYLRDDGTMVPSIGLELSPDFCVGASIPIGKYRFNIVCTKFFPIQPIHYNFANHEITDGNNYNLNTYMSPQRYMCYAAMAFGFSFTYFIK